MKTLMGGLCVLVVSAGLALAQPPKPNIVFIMADDFGWSDTSGGLTNMGNPSDFYETPAIDRLAQQGMAFTNAYAAQNCAPTRAMLLTGQYASRPTNNVFQVDDLNRGGNATMLVGPAQGLPDGDDAIPNAAVTVAETLRTAGYGTAYVGKFHITATPDAIVTDHGFDVNYGGGGAGAPGEYHAAGGQFAGGVHPTLDPYASNYTQEYVDNKIRPFSQGVSEAALNGLVGTPKHVTDAMADAAIDYMDANANEPFLMWYSTFAVHTPIGAEQARDDLLAKYQAKPDGMEDSNAPYAALIEGMDQSVARLINYLENTPDPRNPGHVLADNTLVVFTSDNGGKQDQANNGPLKGQKGELDEGGLRVPMIAWSRNSSLVEGGTVNDTPILAIDYYKTFANLGDATLPSGYTLDGQDLTSILADSGADLGRDNLYWHLPGYLIDDRDQHPQSVIRSGDTKLIYSYETHSWELYNLTADLSEATNLAGTQPATVQQLGTQLITWLDEVDAPLATLRPGQQRIEYTVTGQSYANGQIRTHNNETLIVSPGDEVPIFVGQVTSVQLPPDVVLPPNVSLSIAPPDMPLVGHEQVDGSANIIRIAPANPSTTATETRPIGQTFRLVADAEVGSITVKARTEMSWEPGSHVLQLAIMRDTNNNGIGDQLVGVVETFELGGVNIPAASYITLELSDPVALEAEQTYHFELFWATAHPSHSFDIQRSGNNNGTYANGAFINALDVEGFPFGSRLTFNGTRDLTFFVNAYTVPEPVSSIALSLGILVATSLTIRARKRRSICS